MSIITALFFSGVCIARDGSLPADIEASRYVLDNGLTLILKNDSRTPTFAASLFVRIGSAIEGEFTGTGITHFIEHMIFKGTATRNAIEVQEEIKSYGGVIGASTTHDYTTFKLQGSASSILPLIDIFHDIIANAKFDKKEFKREKEVIKREMRLINDDPSKFLSRRLWQDAYRVHPYRHPIIGYEELFAELEAKDLTHYYKGFYVPNNMVLVIVGDIDIAAIKDKIEETFGKLKRAKLSLPVLPVEPKQMSPRYHDMPYATSKAYLMMGFHTVSVADEDLYALDTLGIILGEGRSSVLHQKLHNSLKLVYDIGTLNYTPFSPGLFLLSATFDYSKKEQVLKEILAEIENVKDNPFGRDELDKAKNQVISAFIFSRESQGAQANELGMNHLVTGDMKFSEHYVDGIKAVTAQDIMDVAKRYLTKDNMTTTVLVPREAEGLEKPHEVLGPLQRTTIEKTLRNGIRVLVTEDKTFPLTSISINMRGGLRAENGQINGISRLTASMITKGTSSRSEEQIFTLVESIGGSLSSYSGNNSLGLSMDVLSKDTKRAVELLADIVTNPAFPDDKLRILKADTLAQIALIKDDIFSSTKKRLMEKLFSGHPYGMLATGTADKIQKIRRKDIYNFYKRYRVGSNIVISVCGDVDADTVIDQVAWDFRRIKKGKPPAVSDIKLHVMPLQVQVRETMDKEQAVVMIGFRSAGLYSPDRYALQILSSLFAGGGGRLFADLRQEKGLAYTLGSFGMTGIDTGSFIFYAAASPENIEVVKDGIISQIRLVCDGDVTDEELDAAKKVLLFKHQVGLQTAAAFSQRIALDELYGFGYDFYKKYIARIEGFTREDIIQVANNYFTIGSCVVSITTPYKNE